MKTTGWILFAAALAMMLTLISADIAALDNWRDAETPAFFGSTIAHLGAVLTAFVGGKLIPSEGAK
jgi:hypothetical protein